MAYKTILYEIEDRLLTITLNRPDRLNAYTRELGGEFIDAIDRADEDDTVRAIIVTGAGRAFCAGADLNIGADGKASFSDDHTTGVKRDGGGLVALRLFDCKKPLIAAVNGAAVGFGATHILPMDIRLAADNAKFGFVFARRGIVPEACSSWFLPRVVGIGTAAEWVYTGRLIGAEEARAKGLVSQVLPADKLLAEARRIGREIADNTSAVSVALSRQMLWSMLTADHPMEAHKLESHGVSAMKATRDGYEGVASFLEKRPANFTLKPSTDMPAHYPWAKPRSFD